MLPPKHPHFTCANIAPASRANPCKPKARTCAKPMPTLAQLTRAWAHARLTVAAWAACAFACAAISQQIWGLCYFGMPRCNTGRGGLGRARAAVVPSSAQNKPKYRKKAP